uniref:Ribosomal silencing factor RsfS n=1 Tax=Caenorhabditis japonica TaxID=281687 RepID=A0A8R1E214_CAEJA
MFLTRFFRNRAASILQSRRNLATNYQIEEEYYEEFTEDSEFPNRKSLESSCKSLEGVTTSSIELEHVIGALTEQRAQDVFVVKVDEKEIVPYSHKIICSTFNARQACAISENLRSLLKIAEIDSSSVTSHVKRSTKRSNGWYVSEIDRMQIHVMSEECREKYNLEAIWSGEDRVLEELENEQQKSFLPPKRATI